LKQLKSAMNCDAVCGGTASRWWQAWSFSKQPGSCSRKPSASSLTVYDTDNAPIRFPAKVLVPNGHTTSYFPASQPEKHEIGLACLTHLMLHLVILQSLPPWSNPWYPPAHNTPCSSTTLICSDNRREPVGDRNHCSTKESFSNDLNQPLRYRVQCTGVPHPKLECLGHVARHERSLSADVDLQITGLSVSQLCVKAPSGICWINSSALRVELPPNRSFICPFYSIGILLWDKCWKWTYPDWRQPAFDAAMISNSRRSTPSMRILPWVGS